jgi:hypothetical protein
MKNALRLTLRTTAVVALLLAAGSSFAARWYEDYERAVNLIAVNNCSREALQLLGAAVVDKPKPRLGARTIAVKTIDYLPYYQLARAHLACEDADSARYYLGISRERGVAPSDLLDALDRRLTEFEARSADQSAPDLDSEELATLVRDVNSTVRQARASADQINRARGDQRFAAFFNSQASALEQAATDLHFAEEQLAEGTLQRDRAAIENAAAAATRSLQSYTSFQAEITAIRQQPPTATPFAAVPTATATRIPFRPATPTPRLTGPEPTDVPIAPRLNPPPLPTRPSDVAESLRRAAAAYLDAEYRLVVRGLSPGEFLTIHERAAAYLLRAASHFALYCLGGRVDEEALGDARRDLQRCRDTDPSLEPDPRFFSPEFITLFHDS